MRELSPSNPCRFRQALAEIHARKEWARDEEEEEEGPGVWVLFTFFRNDLLEGCAVPGSQSGLQRERQ